jgi:ABC-type sugar transport system substrate-binding protein
VAQSIKAGEIKATVLQPIVKFSEMAVEQPDQYIQTGKADKPEKQFIDCVLINRTIILALLPDRLSFSSTFLRGDWACRTE